MKMCGHCGVRPRRATHRWCRECHSANMRERRARGVDTYAALDDDGRRRAKARTHANMAERRGQLVRPELCERCGGRAPEQKHHADYDRPLDVLWLCGECHRKEHRAA